MWSKNIFLRNFSYGTYPLREFFPQKVMASDLVLAFKVKQLSLSSFTAQEIVILVLKTIELC